MSERAIAEPSERPETEPQDARYRRRLLGFLSVASFFEGYDFFALTQILTEILDRLADIHHLAATDFSQLRRDGIVFEHETRYNGRDYGGTRSDNDVGRFLPT